jgi:large subunit ribosomal protein L21
MYAIVRTGGRQFRMEPGAVLNLPLIDAEIGDTVELNEVLLGGENEDTKIGAPTLEGALVKVEVMRHGRDRKIVVGKVKRRKGYRRKQGHRQYFTQVKVSSVSLG